MADEATTQQTDPTANTEKPLANLAAAEQRTDLPAAAVTDPAADIATANRGMGSDLLKPAAAVRPRDPSKPDANDEDIAAPAQSRLRAFEDRVFGKDAVRINGRVERGFGSKFKDMSANQALHYAALEKLIIGEKRLADARTAALDAENAHRAAADEADRTGADLDADATE